MLARGFGAKLFAWLFWRNPLLGKDVGYRLRTWAYETWLKAVARSLYIYIA